MISQTGRRSRNKAALKLNALPCRSRHKTGILTGFTLIELIIVSAIIAVLIAVSSPLFRNTFRDLELKDSAYNVGKIIRYGQQRAIIEEKRYRLLFDFDKGSYRLQMESKREEIVEAEGDDEDAPQKVTVRTWEAAQGRFGGTYYLPENIDFKGDEDKIVFLPNGRCGTAEIYVYDKKNNLMRITTNGRAGYVEVSEEEADKGLKAVREAEYTVR